MQGTGATKSATNLVTADRFANMMHHHKCGTRSIAQSQQRLAQCGHGPRIVLVLVVCGIERIENDDICRSRLCRRHEMVETLCGAKQVAGGARVHQKMLIGGCAESAPHDGEAADELRHGQLELADQYAAWRRHGKANVVRTGC